MEAIMVGSPWLWGGFIAFVIAMLALDLLVFNRKDHVVTAREAGMWACIWISLAALFAGFTWWRFGSRTGLEFVTGYVIELSLSVDNLFVFVVLFKTFGIPAKYQHRVLFWGILSALVLRAAMILGGLALLARFEWLIYVFGAFLLVTGARLLFTKEDEDPHPERSALFRWIRRFVPTTSTFHGHAFFAIENGRRVATPLFVVLMFIEVTDVVFAVDSIPAVFGVTRDPFVVFTSNIFAILGLRTFYFLLARAIDRFRYLKPGLALVLAFVGLKMIGSAYVHVHPAVSLAIIVTILGSASVASWLKTRHEEKPAHARSA
jgi:tellurite resistance protein TerC